MPGKKSKGSGPKLLKLPGKNTNYTRETQARYLAEALILLGVTQAELDQLPKISHITRAVGNTARILEYLAGSEEPVARKMVDFATRLNASQILALPIEALCAAAQVPPKKFLGLLMEEVSEQTKIQSQLLARAAHPDVVAATVASAALIGKEGTQDRKMLHLAEGFVPVPKTNVTFFSRAQIDARQQTLNATLAPVESSVRRITERFAAEPAAISAPVEVLPDDGEDTDDE